MKERISGGKNAALSLLRGAHAKGHAKTKKLLEKAKKLSIRGIRKKTARKAVSAAVAAAMLAASITAAFDSPADIIASGQYAEPTPVVEVVQLAPDDADASEDAESEEKKTRRLRDIARERILRLPLLVRAVFVLPAYCAGWVVLQLLGLAAGTVLPPVISAVAGWLIMTLVVIAASALLIKAVFPDIPLKEILKPKHIAWTAAAVAAVYVICAAVSAFSEDAAGWINLIKFCGCLLTAILAYCAFERKLRGKRA